MTDHDDTTEVSCESVPITERRDSAQVTVELDLGPVALEFSYAPIGRPRYGDVPTLIGTFGTEQEAVLAGAHIVAVGNWHSFVVEKRYGPLATTKGVTNG